MTSIIVRDSDPDADDGNMVENFDRRVRRLQISGSSKQPALYLPKEWLTLMKIKKGDYLVLDLSATREKITIKKLVVEGSRRDGKPEHTQPQSTDTSVSRHTNQSSAHPDTSTESGGGTT